ncbi:uncharacterized protein BX664DRAFT_314016 [Halteromyces radiatus]|uniref:uncharacterized protein n=1 Tax=Halteromyces radiatus TaxID=101107 RepID=UPI00221F8EF7|nr:uncharacterized protein BX664DRAFT_314016 [Halteromyces radiatus]KAI8088743.1 hypothetical protein BX664DRAFT_314016 [Halteromyces radiatus]
MTYSTDISRATSEKVADGTASTTSNNVDPSPTVDVEKKLQYFLISLTILIVFIAGVLYIYACHSRRNRTEIVEEYHVYFPSNPTRYVPPYTSRITSSKIDLVFPQHIFQNPINTKDKPSFDEHHDEQISLHHLWLSSASQTCIICLEEFIHDHSSIRQLPCKHIYHVHCIDSWLARSQVCPLCKTDCTIIQKQEGVPASLSNENPISPSTSRSVIFPPNVTIV